MKQSNFGKVEFYKVAIDTCISLIEERSGLKLEAVDPTLERRVDCAFTYNNIKDLKAVLEALDEMYATVKKKALTA